MRNFYIKDLEKLRKILEDPREWKHYLWFTGGRKILDATVKMYEHPDGAKIAGKHGRWWVYVNVKYAFSDEQEPYEYDIALWKLRSTPLLRKLIESGALEIRESESELVSA